MRWILGLLFLITLALIGGYIFFKGYPYRLYSHWVSGKEWNRYYEIPNYRPLFLKSPDLDAIAPYKEDYVQLWKEFPLRNSLIPLPVRHPLFLTVPIAELKVKTGTPQIGMTILSSSGRELSRIYTAPTALYQDHSMGQELFKLPFVKNRILKKDLDTLWKDIFSYIIEDKSKSMDEMIYDLYILHLRSKILPAETLRYGLIKDGKQALLELESKDKDYKVELVLTQSNGSIYSYILVTEKVNEESLKMRSKFLESISFSPIDPSMGRLLYTEFKQLNFARQVDQEGMLYLFSAWSQDFNSAELFKEMIFYLERGRNNQRQLKNLYQFAFVRYGKTFTTKKDLHGDDADGDMGLQRKIEVEDIEKKQAADRVKERPPVEVELAPDEKMNIYLKKAKESGPTETKEMTVH
jgi:hypothetical protein